jgi:hypothetical protein
MSPGEKAKVVRYSKEDGEQRTVAKIVEPLLKLLVPGQHYFGPEQFDALASYLLVDALPVTAALSDGRFSVASRALTVIRVTKMTASRMVTASALAKTTGIPRRTLALMLANSRLPYLLKGRQKLYSIEQVRGLLAKNGEEGRRVTGLPGGAHKAKP